VFERDGFLKSRIADICEEADVSQPSFYTYFHSKEELFSEVVGSVDFGLLDVPRGDGGDDPMGRLRAANRHYLEFYRDNAGILAVIDEVATFDEAVRSERREGHDRFARAIEGRIRQYQEQGCADDRVNAAFAANALGSMVTSVATQMFITGSTSNDLDLAVEQLTVLWANAIGLAGE
jgi:AcrR family transcriptional regulator